MSNFILLIMDTYNEKEKNDKNIISKNKLEDFVKENKLICFMFILLGISLILFEVFAFTRMEHGKLFMGISLLMYAIIFLILVPLTEKSSQKNYDRHIKMYNLRLNLLRDILKYDFKLYEHGKIEKLIEQSDFVIESFKLSKEIFKPIIVVTKSIVLPIITFALGVLTKNIDLGLDDTIILTFITILTVFMILGICYVFKNSIETYLDSTSNKVKRLKGMLIDIYIKDFIEKIK